MHKLEDFVKVKHIDYKRKGRFSKNDMREQCHSKALDLGN
jgi:hypothetical protein